MAEEQSTGKTIGSKTGPQGLHTIFDNLSVSQDLNLQKTEERCDEVGCREEKNNFNTLTNARKSPSKCATKHRVKPYRKDNLPFSDQSLLPAMNILSFKAEQCDNKNCQCNAQHALVASTDKSCDTSSLNFAKVCRETRIVLREPRLKLHHAQKDHRVVLRAARLKLAAKSPLHHLNKPLANTLKAGTVSRKTVFGSSSEKPEVNEDFRSLIKGTKKSTNLTTEIESSLSDYRSSSHRRHATLPAVVAGSSNIQGSSANGTMRKSNSDIDLRQLGVNLPSDDSKKLNLCPLHPDLCTRPCSCSMQAARIDDCTMDELACYFEDLVHIPKKMSAMAEMMYT